MSDTDDFSRNLKMFKDREGSTKGRPVVKPKPAAPKPKTHDTTTGALFDRPHQLVVTETEEGTLHCVEETLTLLHKIDRQVNSVAITGQFRTGKSYLLNRLAGCTQGFDIGNATIACTKGIWLWCRDHPTQKGQVLLLLDVEGFGDIFKANEREDFLLFTLATLLSSTMVYNNKGAFGMDAINKLQFLENIESSVCVVDKENDVDMLDFYFPQFVLTLRDLALQVQTRAGKKASPDEYFEDVLVQQRGKGKEIAKYNRIRLLIRNYFKERKCFIFRPPCPDTEHLDKKGDSDLNPEFLRSLQAFQDFVYGCKPMAMKSGKGINGRMFASLVRTYVDQIREEKPPCIRDAFVTMTHTENNAVIEEASKIYSKEMQKRLNSINPNDRSLVNHHQQCMEKALDHFKAAIVFDDEQICNKHMEVRFKELFKQFKRVCDKNSEARCQEVLNRLNLKIVRKLKDNVYAKPGGYDEYIDDINNLVKKYDGTCGLGTKSRNALQSFLDGKAEEEELVYQLVLKSTGEQEEQRESMASITIQRKASTGGPVKRSESHHIQLTEDVENMERQLNRQMEQEQKQTYEDIKVKYIGKLSLQLQELDRQLQEGDDEQRNKVLLEERTFITKLIDATKGIPGVAEKMIEKSKESESPRQDTEMQANTGERKEENVYAVPWEYCRLPPIGMEEPGVAIDPVHNKDETEGGTSSNRRKFCFLQ